MSHLLSVLDVLELLATQSHPLDPVAPANIQEIKIRLTSYVNTVLCHDRTKVKLKVFFYILSYPCLCTRLCHALLLGLGDLTAESLNWNTLLT